MKKNRGWLILISLVLMMFPMLASSAWAGSVKVITGASTSVDSIGDKDIKKIFLGKTKSLPDGSPVEFVVLDSGDTHTNFLKTYVQKSASQYKTYWKKQVFTGKGKNPTSFGSESELIAYVAGKAGTIGYVSASADTAGTKVLNEK